MAGPLSPLPWILGVGWVESPSGTFTWTWDLGPDRGALFSNGSPNNLVACHSYRIRFNVDVPNSNVVANMLFSIYFPGDPQSTFSQTPTGPTSFDFDWTIVDAVAGTGLLIEPQGPFGSPTTIVVSNVLLDDLSTPAILGMTCEACPS